MFGHARANTHTHLEGQPPHANPRIISWWPQQNSRVDEEGTGGPETGAPTEADGGAQQDGGGGSEPVPSTECSEHTAPIGRTENPWGVPVSGRGVDSAGFGGGGDDCCDDERELPADGAGGRVRGVRSDAHGGAG